MFLHPIKMRKLNLYISTDHIKAILYELGKHNLIEFINLNGGLKPDELPFAKELMWYERKKSKLEVFYNELEEANIPIEDITVSLETSNVESLSSNLDGNNSNLESYNSNLNTQDTFIKILNQQDDIKDNSMYDDLEGHFTRLQELKSMKSSLSDKLKELKENLKILSLLNSQELTTKSCCSGIIDTSKLGVLKKILDTVLRKNYLLINSQYDECTAFLIFTHGVETYKKLIQICTSFGARIYSETADKNLENYHEEAHQDGEIHHDGENIHHDREFEDGESEQHEKFMSDELSEQNNKMSSGRFGFLSKLKSLSSTRLLAQKTQTEKQDTTQNKNVNKSEILKVNSLIKQYTSLLDSNTATLSRELQQIASKICTWHKNVRTNLKILTAMNKMQMTTAFTACAWVPDTEMRVFETLVNQICESTGRIAYEDQNYLKPELITGLTSAHQNDTELKKYERNSIDEEYVRDSNDSENRNSFDEESKKSQDENQLKHRSTDETLSNEDVSLVIVRSADNLSNSLEELRQAKHQQKEIPQNTDSESQQIPPTFIKTNKFTKPFQDMNDVYGVPSHTELNPSLFTAISFPLLFGSMFGDVGHGIILLCISFLFIKYDRLKNVHEMVKLVVNAKYLLLACSIYAIFFGFIYSDFLGLPIPFFRVKNFFSSDPSDYITLFGVNPEIHHRPDFLNIMNGIKMKLSILIGFLHMFVGLAINVLNTFYKNDKSAFLCKTLPKLMSYGVFTGYLSILIIAKFINPFNQSIINTIVTMFTDPFNKTGMFYPGQFYIQMLLLSIFILSVPWMMVSYPIVCLMKKRKQKRMLINQNENKINKNLEMKSDNIAHNEHEEESLMDTAIHTGIETIEFNLGLISNISSYLRIWAVSLAHSQLTSILHTYTLGSQFNILIKICLVPFWFAVTFALMICLEGLSASLHAMRLNWIEFNSKFYVGSGRKFRPLSFDEESCEEEE